jgi:hypothetical protein
MASIGRPRRSKRRITVNPTREQPTRAKPLPEPEKAPAAPEREKVPA